MAEQLTLDLSNRLPLPDLERLLRGIDVTSDPLGIAAMRRYLMRLTATRTPTEKLALLRPKIVIPNAETISALLSDLGGITKYKFVREKEQIIIFPDQEKDDAMHIHYAVAAGMYLPDDGGFLTFHSLENKCEVGGSSSSLHVSPSNNLARPHTIQVFRPMMPNGAELFESMF